MGNQAWVKAMPWDGQDAFNAAPKTKFVVSGSPAGEAQESRLSGRFASSMRKVSGGMGFL